MAERLQQTVSEENKVLRGKVLCNIQGHSASVLCCAFNADGKVLATCSADKSVIIWSISRDENQTLQFCQLKTLLGHEAEVTSCCFYENILATSSKDKTVILWLHEKGTRASRLAVHLGPVLSCVFSPDGRFLATASADKTARLLTFYSGLGAFVKGSEIKRLSGHRGSVNDVQFAPSVCYLATASDDKTIRLWDVESGDCKMSLDNSLGAVWKIRFTPCGVHMISLSAPGDFLSVWNMDNKNVENVLEANNGREIQNIAICPEGLLTVGLSKDNKIIIWDKWTTKCIPELRSTKHSRGINTIAMAPDNSCVVTGDGEGQLLIWT